MMINKINPALNYKYWLKHLDTQLNKQTNKLNKVLKVVETTNKKILS